MASKRNTYKLLFAKSKDNRTLWRPFISLDVVKMQPFEEENECKLHLQIQFLPHAQETGLQ